MMPRISFIMPAWKAAYLHEAIKSIVAQTFPDWELVIVDDHSPEDLKSVVDCFDDRRIRYYRNEKNIGGEDLVAQWNHSISYAQGEYLVLAADDDEYYPDFCSECIALAQEYPRVDVIRSAVEQIDGSGKHVGDDSILPKYTGEKEFFDAWIHGGVFSCMGNFMFRTQAIKNLGGFIDYPCAFGTDIATPLALSSEGVANTGRMLFRFRLSEGHLSADSKRFKEKLAGITQLSLYLRERNSVLKAVEDGYLAKKCIYDYFNLVIKYLPAKSLKEYLGLCTLASPLDKAMMIMRYIKSRI